MTMSKGKKALFNKKSNKYNYQVIAKLVSYVIIYTCPPRYRFANPNGPVSIVAERIINHTPILGYAIL